MVRALKTVDFLLRYNFGPINACRTRVRADVEHARYILQTVVHLTAAGVVLQSKHNPSKRDIVVIRNHPHLIQEVVGVIIIDVVRDRLNLSLMVGQDVTLAIGVTLQIERS